MDRFAQFLHEQITTDLDEIKTIREQIEAGRSRCSHQYIVRGFRECEVKSRLLDEHRRCGSGAGPCDRLGTAYLPEDERGCATRAALGIPYADRAGYRPRWRP